jgi:hypothetical protein
VYLDLGLRAAAVGDGEALMSTLSWNKSSLALPHPIGVLL